MAIRFRCPGCGRPFEVRDQLAGKTAQCKQCGNRIQIPETPAVAAPVPAPAPAPVSAPAPAAVAPPSPPPYAPYRTAMGRPAEPVFGAYPPPPAPGFAPPRPAAGPAPDVYGLNDSGAVGGPEAPLPPRGKGGWVTRPVAGGPASRPARAPRRAAPASSGGYSRSYRSSRFGVDGMTGFLAVVLVAGAGALRGYYRQQQNNAPAAPPPPVVNAPAPAPAPVVPGPAARPEPTPVAEAAGLDGPIALPAFPAPGPAREVAPGVEVREVVFGPSGQAIPPGTPPGHAGKLWVYTPSGNHPARSLPCVFIAPAGSNLITGMTQGDGDRPEHLPWARAGFAVVAYELDGYPGEVDPASDHALDRAARQFLAARAGRVNARVAIEYALARIPEVDPNRLATAGHSSAGTVAVLAAEGEPRIRACVAFAGALDLPDRFGLPIAGQLRRSGFGALVDRFSPSSDVARLGCPLFLFHALDDTVVPSRQSQKFASDAQALGKDVTSRIVARGGHYRGMIAEGIPAAIEWARQKLGPGSGN